MPWTASWARVAAKDNVLPRRALHRSSPLVDREDCVLPNLSCGAGDVFDLRHRCSHSPWTASWGPQPGEGQPPSTGAQPFAPPHAKLMDCVLNFWSRGRAVLFKARLYMPQSLRRGRTASFYLRYPLVLAKLPASRDGVPVRAISRDERCWLLLVWREGPRSARRVRLSPRTVRPTDNVLVSVELFVGAAVS